MRYWLSILLIFGVSFSLQAQCDVPLDQVDEFDSTRVIASEAVSFGYLIPSKYETEDGPKLVREGKALFMYTKEDTLNAFFMTLAVPEYSYFGIDNGFNVYLKLSDGEVIRVYNIPDKGTFDDQTNMRVYQHTLAIPLDLFYRLTFSTIEKVRITYKTQKRTFELSPKQQEDIRKAIQCVGKASGLYPVKP